MSIIIFIAIFAPFLAPHDPLEQFRGFTKLPPFWVEGSDSRFILGTDAVGRDMLSRLIYGARISLFIGLSVMVVSMIVGVALGLAAAWFGGIVDVVILRIMDLIMSIPSLVLAILIIAIIGPNLTNTIVAVAVVCVPSLCAPGARLGPDRTVEGLCHRRQGGGQRPLAADDRDRPSQLHGAAHRAGGTWRLRCDS